MTWKFQRYELDYKTKLLHISAGKSKENLNNKKKYVDSLCKKELLDDVDFSSPTYESICVLCCAFFLLLLYVVEYSKKKSSTCVDSRFGWKEKVFSSEY